MNSSKSSSGLFSFPLLLPLFFLLLAAGPALRAADSTLDAARPTARQVLDRAQRLNNQFYMNKARAVLEEGIALYPEDWRLHRLYIQVHDDMECNHELVPFYTDWIAKHPNSPVGYAGAALVNLGIDHRGVAEDFYRQARKLDPEGLATLFLAPLIDPWVKGEFKEKKAREAYEKLVKAYPDFSPGWNNYLSFLAWSDPARLRRMMPEIKARKDLDPGLWAYELSAAKPDIWHDPRKDAELYESILKADPSLAWIRLRLSNSLGDLGEAARQRELVEENTREAPEWVLSWTNMARFCRNHQQYDQAVQYYERARQTPYSSSRKDYLTLNIVYCLVQAGRFEEALGRLQEIIKNPRDGNEAQVAREGLVELLSRKPGDKIYRLKEVPYLVQKGTYCGPASLSMALGYWGVHKTQDEIATVIYTGIAGTAAETIQTYCATLGFEARAFQGSVEAWKRLLDQGVPILWLQYSGTGGHYRVVTGYNDVRKEFILHNPWRAEEETFNYDGIHDNWLLPDLRLSLAIVPKARAAALNLGALEAPLTFRLINQVSYVTTGSNLFGGLFPQALWDLLIPAGLLGICLLLIRKVTYPGRGGTLGIYAAFILAAGAAMLVAIHVWRPSIVVSLFLSLQGSLLLLAVILFTIGLVNVTGRISPMTPRQAIRVHGAVFIGIASVGLINHRDTHGIDVPVLLIIIGAFVALREQFMMSLRCGLRRRLNYEPVLAILARYGSAAGSKGPMLCAVWLEIILEMRRRNFARAESLARGLLAAGGLSRYHRNWFRLALAECLANAPEDAADPARLAEARTVLDALAADRPRRLAALHAEILRARIAIRAGETGEAAALCENVETRLNRRDWVLAAQRAMETLRSLGTVLHHFAFLHALNRLAVARAAGDEAAIAAVRRELGDAHDQDYMMKAELGPAR